MGMIRVSDGVEKQLKELADGRSMSATVEMLIKGATNTAEKMFGGGGGELVAATAGVIKEHIDKKFNELKALIEDTTVDRLAARDYSKPSDKEYLDWPLVQDIFYDLCWAEDSPEWVSKKMHDDMSELNESLTCFIQDGTIYSEDLYGHAYPILKVSQRVQKFIDERKAA